MLDFSTLWRNHPTIIGVSKPCTTNGVSNYPDQCAIRMGVCLRRSGFPLKGPRTCQVAKATGHVTDDMHFLAAQEVATALRGTSFPGLGTTEYYKVPDTRDFANKIDGRTGIVFFKGYWFRTGETTVPTGNHIDLWNGWRTTAKILLPWFGWLGGYDGSGEIWFWEVR